MSTYTSDDNPYDRFWRQAMRSTIRGHNYDLDPDYVRRATLAYPSIVKQEPAIRLNEGTRYEEPFGVTRALEWAQRLAAKELS